MISFPNHPHVAKAHAYALDVLAGKIPNCEWVIAACQRFIDDLAGRGPDFPFVFDADAAEKFCNFAEALPHVKGKWEKAKQNLLLEPWECFIGCNLFGWIHRTTKRRRFRKAYIKIPRKNGKSVLAASIGLFMWCMDGESGSEVYSGATTEKQAWEAFRPARKMVEKTPDLVDWLGGGEIVRAKSLFIEEDESRFEPVIGKPGDGASPSCAIVDEFHEHDTSDLVDTMETGMLAREQPLLLMITTAGYNIGGPCYDQELDAQKVLQRILIDENFFALMYGIDKDDDWTDPRVLIKANPNYGVSVDPEILQAAQRQAVINPIHQNKFKTKHLNVWCSARMAWMPMAAWEAEGCKDLSLKREEFNGQKAWFILDLASKDDIACFAELFKKKIHEQDHYFFFASYYIPEGLLEDPDNTNAGIYQKWVKQGFITPTEGNEIDFDVIHDDVMSRKSKVQVREIVYDPWRATQLAHQFQKKGVKQIVEVGASTAEMSIAMKEMQSAVKGLRFHHDGNPVTTWMISNVTCKIDARDNIFPRKEKPHLKIDGAVSAIMGMSRACLDSGKAGLDNWLNNPVNPNKPNKEAAAR